MNSWLLFHWLFFIFAHATTQSQETAAIFYNKWNCLVNVTYNPNCANFEDIDEKNPTTSNLFIPSDVVSKDQKIKNYLSSFVTCHMCMAVVTTIEKYSDQGKPAIKVLAHQMCNRLLLLSWPCSYLVDQIVDEAIDKVLQSYPPSKICGEMFGFCSTNLNEMLSIIDTMEMSLISYDEEKDVVIPAGFYSSISNDVHDNTTVQGDVMPEFCKKKPLQPQVDWAIESQFIVTCQQGKGGICYSIVATDVIQYSIYHDLKQKEPKIYLSYQEIAQCSSKDPGGNKDKDGGTYDIAFNYVYNNGIGLRNQFEGCDKRVPKYGLESSQHVNGNKEFYQHCLMDGPLAASIHVDDGAEFRDYDGNILAYECDGRTPNHAVTIVGFKVVYGILVFVIRNTGGPNWGKAGYAYISTEAKNPLCIYSWGATRVWAEVWKPKV